MAKAKEAPKGKAKGKEIKDKDLDRVSGGSHPAPGQDPNSPNDGVGSAKDKNQGSSSTSW